MKKIVLATVLAVSAITASAQVTLYGRVATFVDSTKTGSAEVTSLVNDSSRIGIKVNEDLGNGLSAIVVVETTVSADDPKAGTATQLGDRQSTIGLASKLGTVDLGRKEHSEYITMKNADPFVGATYASISPDVINIRDKRIGDGVFLGTTVGPVTATVDRSMYTAATTAEATSWSLTGTAGPVTAAVARFTTGADYTNVVTASGQLAGVTLSTIQSEDKSSGVKTTGRLYGASLPVPGTALSVKGSYGTKTGVAASEVKAYNLGVNYAFSKRTSVLVAYRNVNAVGVTNDVKQYGVGLVHSF
jgi:predicted porin